MILTLTRSHQQDQNGLEVLYLQAPGFERLRVLSGAPGRQNFRTRADAQPGRLEPIPEGEYQLGPLEWAGQPGDLTTWWSGALGPVWVTIDPDRAIGFHLDANAATSPGTAGCVGLRSRSDLREFAEWWKAASPPTHLVVDWGLGSRPEAGQRRWKCFAHSGRVRVIHDGKPQPAGSLKLDAHDGKLGLVVGGQQVKPVSVSVEIVYVL